jgi:NAD(P)-dependent dehydrogenase (short-subunit alcohol dehydrogenase family)
MKMPRAVTASAPRALPKRRAATVRSVAQLMDLTGRRAFVTGAAGHVGRMVCGTLAELGASVALADLDGGACERDAKTLMANARKIQAVPVSCNLSDEAATRRAIRTAIERLGGLEILVHCAAYVGTSQMGGWAAPLSEQSVAAWDAALRVNLTAAFILAQEAQTALSQSGQGSVIFISSIYGVSGPDFRLYEGTTMANPAGYGVSKGGLLQLTRHLATALAPRVRVNAISPGGIERGQPHEFQERYVQRTPMGRMASEEDLKGAVAYLASDLSSYVTGQNLMVDGGWTAW